LDTGIPSYYTLIEMTGADITTPALR